MNRPRQEAKIFCIGLSKTGTTSLAAALRRLGYGVRDNMGATRYVRGDVSCVDPQELEAYDAFTDTPIPSFYRELDAKYPGAKFILTVRDLGPWLKSCKKQFTQKHIEARSDAINQLFQDLYDSAAFDEEKFASGYNRFVTDVMDYFKDRPEDLLILDLGNGDGWDKLCGFLGTPVPDEPFPVTNVTTIQWIKTEQVIAIARQAGKKIPPPHSLQPSHSAEENKGIIGRLTGKALDLAANRRRAELPNLLESAHKIITDGLAALNAPIPILSSKNADTPYEERKTWHHAWLIDTFSGANGLLEGHADYAISIALIENGAPRLGVVYFPASDIVYFTKEGKTSHVQIGEEPPLRLEPAQTSASQTAATSGSVQWALCQVAAGNMRDFSAAGPFNEWEIAAAHAILRGTGKSLLDGEKRQAARYNKERPVSGPLTVK